MIEKEAKVPSLSQKEAYILKAMLSNSVSEMCGKDIIAQSHKYLKRGTAYVTLSRMEDKGYVESRVDRTEEEKLGLPKRMYKITVYGKRMVEIYELSKEALGLDPTTLEVIK